jgi:hypothetical protein
MAPADLHYGAHHRAKDSQFFIADPVTGEVRLTETAAEFNLASRKYHETLINIAAQYQLAENERNIERRSSPDNVQYDIGDYVLLSPHRGLGSARRAKDKLTTQWQWPYKIVAIIGNTITVSSINKDSFQDVNIREIKIFRESSSSSAASMETIAALDKNEYIVASIVTHEWSSRKPKDLMMLVHWEGYGSSEDTWESWSALKDNIVAQEYCNQNADLHRLVKKQFRENHADK